MCIAILLPEGKEIDYKTLHRCYEENSDGFGYAYFDKELVLSKEVDKKKIERSINRFINLRKKFIDKPFLVHFRIATHGKISTRCCHPFRVNKDVVFCHNGILSYDYGVDKNSLNSDTMMFNKNILQRLNKDELNDMIKGKNSVLKELIEGYIGSRNKMILLHRDGDYTILNEHKGIWDAGIWYSNDSYKEKMKWNNFGYGFSYSPYYQDDWYGEYWDDNKGSWEKYTPTKWKKGYDK